MKNRNHRLLALIAAAMLAPASAWGQLVIQEDFTGAAATNSWQSLLGACLTAGNNTGTIPACFGNAYYSGQTQVGGYTGTLPDPAGNGALRFTNGYPNYQQAGGIISNFTFPSNQGLHVTFKTVTYLGNSGGSGSDGADGIGFFLIDGSIAAPYAGKFDVGAFGGSLGYTCTDETGNDDPHTHPDGITVRHFDGLVGGYLGLGIDEYGNFLNQGDNTASGYGYQPDRIGLRGAGSINWYSLSTGPKTASYYPSTLSSSDQAQAVLNTCRTGHIWDYSGGADGATDTGISLPDYGVIPNAYQVLPSTLQIANESAKTRGQAVPITYDLKITQTGLLSFSYSYNGGAYRPVITGQSIAASNGPLPSSFRFGFAGSSGGSDNVHEILCFKATPADVASTSVSVNEKEAAKIATGTQAYLADYYPTTWTGRLTANNLLFDPSTGIVSVAAAANWDASCVLTGVPTGQTCPTTGGGTTSAEAPSSRVMMTWNGSNGVPFEWTKLTSSEQGALDQGDPSPINSNRLMYLRGDRSNEITASGTGTFRMRTSVLGDIIDSSPTWVGPPSSPYTLTWKDRVYPSNAAPENGSQSYPQFITNERTRLNVVYSGSNDGFVHGFRTGSYDANGLYVNNSTTPNDGMEVLAYMPAAVLQSIHNSSNSALDFSSPQYAHNFYVDATPDAEDLFYQNAWHTWLVGGLGAGGKDIYALDVTDPSSFSESNAANTVVGEWSSSTLTCVNVSSCGQNLGNTYGTPVIRRLHNGAWAVIFGNGYGSASGDAGIYVMSVDPASGSKSFYYLSAGQTGKSDGIAYPSPADLDGDHITDFVYAGDLRGNVWRFDLTSSNPANWHVTAAPVFTDPSGNAITTKVALAVTPLSQGGPRLMVDFGTGRKQPLTVTSPAQYASGTEYLYGIWDSNMSSWNALGSVAYTSLTSPPSSIPRSSLQVQTLTPGANGVLDGSNNPICWAGVVSCSSNPQYGWYIALPGKSEQVIYNPLTYLDALLVNTTIPPNDSPLSCAAASETGNTIAISVSTGGVIRQIFPDYSDAQAAGQQTNGVGTPFVVLAGGFAHVLTQTAGSAATPGSTPGMFACSGNSCSAKIKPTGPTGHRLTWTEVR